MIKIPIILFQNELFDTKSLISYSKRILLLNYIQCQSDNVDGISNEVSDTNIMSNINEEKSQRADTYNFYSGE